MNATQAAIRAGYSRKTAYSIGDENLRKPYISAEIAHRQRQIAENLKLTHEVVVAGLHREATLRGEAASHGARVSAWVQLGKHLGMFDKGIDISNHPEVREVRRGLVRFIDATHSAIRDLCPPQLAEDLQARILESIDPTSPAAEHAPNIFLIGRQTVDVNRPVRVIDTDKNNAPPSNEPDRYADAIESVSELEDERGSVDVSVGVSVRVPSPTQPPRRPRRSIYDVPEGVVVSKYRLLPPEKT